jgi:hypothetical protein
MPPSGDYSLHIAPAAARATINTAIMQNIPTLMAISMVIAMEEVQGFHISHSTPPSAMPAVSSISS